ncbi:hypothetical protein ACN1NW_000462 [Acinetobacter baumannii]|nr:hypothetical protein [Acinetobacter baumannii]ELA7031044.1 hypothetical protein [Acinetobacter baumannii]ELA7118807.1 hypothetical protein [Acinetobacter baumannii]ELB0919757.1 hypothetical protein [Acinetobacter baumannii]ELB0965934.1 hypothetical protein [Acinetobacter baumannii]
MSFLKWLFGSTEPAQQPQEKSVDLIIGNISKQVEELSALQEAKLREASGHGEAAARILFKQDQANTEAERARLVASSLSTLISVPKDLTIEDVKKEIN